MNKILYLNSKQIKKIKPDIFQSVISQAVKFHYHNFYIYNIDSDKSLISLLQSVKNKKCQLIVRCSLDFALKNFDLFFENRQIICLIIEVIFSKLSTQNDIQRLFQVNRTNKKIIGFVIKYRKNGDISCIEKWLQILCNFPLKDLIIESKNDFIETVRNQDFIDIFVKFDEFLKKINFQCTFLPEFKPKKCLFLDMHNDILTLQKNGFSNCPNNNVKIYPDKKSLKNGNIDFDMIEKSVREYKEDIIKHRFKLYTQSNRKFNCKTCISISDITH